MGCVFVAGLVDSSFVGLVGFSYGSTWFRMRGLRMSTLVAAMPCGLLQKSGTIGT